MKNRGVGLSLILAIAPACASTVSQSAASPDVADAATFDAPEVASDIPSVDRPPPDAPAPLPSRLTIRERAGYLRRLNGSAVAWGDGSGPLGGMLTDAGMPPNSPRAVPTPESRLFVGRDSVCNLDSVGALRCWAENANGQLGNGGRDPVSAPGRAILDDVVDVAAGINSWCALRRDGSVWCWGTYIESYDPEPGDVPRRIDMPTPLVRIVGGGATHHFNGIDAAGRVWCWGAESIACLADFQITRRAVEIADARDPASIVLGRGFSCSLSANGDVRCWGEAPLGPMPVR